MRLLILLFIALGAGARAAQHECSAPLVLPLDADLPSPEFSFRLSLVAGERFTAEGHHFDGETMTPLNWEGAWIRVEDGLHLIGPVDFRESTREWRAHAVILQEDVMILNVTGPDAALLMVRCLTREGA